MALGAIQATGHAAAKATWFDVGSDRFLEIERFDRIRRRGRLGVISLSVVNDYFYGNNPDSWSKAATRFRQDPEVQISEEDIERVRWLDTYGELIGNTDRHFGNISFFAEEAEHPMLALAPIYDMLPMVFSPRSGRVVESVFAPRPPSATNFDIWDDVAAKALEYWDMLVHSTDLSGGFRQLCSVCRWTLDKLVRDR